jgi:hypothetical protein
MPARLPAPLAAVSQTLLRDGQAEAPPRQAFALRPGHGRADYNLGALCAGPGRPAESTRSG